MHNPLYLGGLDVRVAPGESVGTVGRDGSEKPTLLKVIGRLLRPKNGKVCLNGMDFTALRTEEVGQRQAVLSQATASPQQLTVRELVGYGRFPNLSWLDRFGTRDREVIQETIESCWLGFLRERPLSPLSGGERQKTWIALALEQQPQLMLLDVPVTLLDLGHNLEVIDFVAELNQLRRITIVIVLHDIILAARYCPCLITWNSGSAYADGLAELSESRRRPA